MTRSARISVAAVGFDLGETLYHYREPPMKWIEKGRPALETVVEACGIDRTKADIASAHKKLESYSDHLREHIEEVSAADVMTDVLAALGGNAGEHMETAVDAFFGFFRVSLEAYPSAIKTLKKLKKAGFKTGALTNVPFGMPRRTIEEDLARVGLAPYLDNFVTSGDVGMRKPHRAPFEWLAATLGVAMGEMAYVGNLPTDVSGALAGGCIPIFLDRTDNGIDFGQAATVHHLDEIPPLLELTKR